VCADACSACDSELTSSADLVVEPHSRRRTLAHHLVDVRLERIGGVGREHRRLRITEDDR
jgi:hypothetical protein